MTASEACSNKKEKKGCISTIIYFPLAVLTAVAGKGCHPEVKIRPATHPESSITRNVAETRLTSIINGQHKNLDDIEILSKISEESDFVTIEKIESKSKVTELHEISHLNRPVNSIELFNFFPINEKEFIISFERLPSAKEASSIKNLESKIQERSRSNNFSDFSENELQLKIKNSNNDLIIIFAHSRKNGEVIVFPSGKTLDRTDIHRICRNAEKNCLILTCNGSDFLIHGSLAADHAIKMYDRAAGLLKRRSSQQNSIVTLGEIRSEMIQERNTSILKEQIYISVIAVSPTGVYMAISASTDTKLSRKAN